MKYEVKSFKDQNPQSGAVGFKDKDSEATEWLNQMAAKRISARCYRIEPYLSQPALKYDKHSK